MKDAATTEQADGFLVRCACEPGMMMAGRTNVRIWPMRELACRLVDGKLVEGWRCTACGWLGEGQIGGAP